MAFVKGKVGTLSNHLIVDILVHKLMLNHLETDVRITA